jgi:hypothetical protein
MEAVFVLIAIAVLVFALAAFDAAAVAFGVDSRPQLQDDHRR